VPFMISRAPRYFISLILAAQMAACTFEAHVSGFEPVDPPVTFTSNPLKPIGLDWPTVSTLQPTLRWEPIPGVHYDHWTLEEQPFITADLAHVTNVSYDLRIWKTDGGPPVMLVYEQDAIRDTAHKLETPLAPSSLYYWSVRARFDLDGKTRISEWSLSLFPGGGFYDPRRVSRETGVIPPANYYRFKTPDD